jgi:hypothetical protein
LPPSPDWRHRDGLYLQAKARQQGISVPPYIASGHGAATSTASPEPSGTHPLLARLRAITPGQAGRPAYEKYCTIRFGQNGTTT